MYLSEPIVYWRSLHSARGVKFYRTHDSKPRPLLGLEASTTLIGRDWQITDVCEFHFITKKVILRLLLAWLTLIFLPKPRCYNEYATAPSSTTKNQVPSPDYWKGKCWQDIYLAESLRDYGKSGYLQANGLERSAGTLSKLCYSTSLGSLLDQIKLDPSMEVGDIVAFVGYYWRLSQRGKHRIEDEIVFSNHDGYIFHDSRGFESGSKKELEIVQNFVRQKSGEKRLASRLHAIWFRVFIVYDCEYWRSYLKVLHPNGQPTTRAWFEAFQRYLPRSKWCVSMKRCNRG